MNKNYPHIHSTNYNYIYIYIIELIKKYTSCIIILFIFNQAYAQDENNIQLANEYLSKGEKQKALELYQDLARKSENISYIHNNYFSTLLELQQYREAEEYIKKQIKREQGNFLFELDYGLLMLRTGDVARSDKQFRQVITGAATNPNWTRYVSDYFTVRSLIDYAILTYQESRKTYNNAGIYALELANLYRYKSDRPKMAEEYLNYATQNLGNNQYVKSLLQAMLTKPEELEELEKILILNIQKDPANEVYSDLLIWLSLQQKNFNTAFIQARAYDKRYKTQGERCMEVAEIALKNKDYASANQVFQYVLKNFTDPEFNRAAALGSIRSRDAMYRNQPEINKDSVQKLVRDYKKFVQQNTPQPAAFEAARHAAMLQAEMLQQTDSAQKQLQQVIAHPQASAYIKAKCKIDLADLFILKNEPWESALLYAQVEKTQKENPVAYEAKLKHARLAYYRGDFLLAEEQLNILKQATTREIANDAIELSMRIKENLLADSAAIALREFAQVELLLKQNKIAEAWQKLNAIEEGRILKADTTLVFTNYAIIDDCYWLKASILLKQNKPEQALAQYEKIVTEFFNDVLADDAFFAIGDIYENYLHQPEKAMEHYKNLLVKFPGSVYAAEARKRYRMLRGDFSSSTPEPKL
ncbi:MAG: tetratricopeptide repeat protein [Chryseotalea sp.]